MDVFPIFLFPKNGFIIYEKKQNSASNININESRNVIYYRNCRGGK